MGIRATQNPLECTPAVLSRFLGEFASLVALQTAHPLPTSGSYAVVNETGSDLIYYWSDADQDYFTPQGTSSGGTVNFQQVTENGAETTELVTFKSGVKYLEEISGKYNIVGSEGGQFYVYEGDEAVVGDTLLFAVSGDEFSVHNRTSGLVIVIKKPVSGTSNLIAPQNSSDETIATQEWTNSAINSAAVGFLDDRGNWNASDNLFPNIGGSGDGGAILRGDLWTISVGGTLGGTAVSTGDVVRALVDSPGQTASNWSVTENNIGYVPENSANKATSMAGNTASNVVFLSAKAVFDWVTGLGYMTPNSWVDYSAISTIVGFASFTTREIRYLVIGNMALYYFNIDGTSNSTSFTFTTHANHAGATFFTAGGFNRNGGTTSNNAPRILMTNASNVITLAPSLTGGSWTGTTSVKSASGFFIIQL